MIAFWIWLRFCPEKALLSHSERERERERERARKDETSTKNIWGTQIFLNSTLRVPVARLGWKVAHFLSCAFGFIIASRNLWIYGIIPLSWFNYSTDKFKINVKKLLLSTWFMTLALKCLKLNIINPWP